MRYHSAVVTSQNDNKSATRQPYRRGHVCMHVQIDRDREKEREKARERILTISVFNIRIFSSKLFFPVSLLVSCGGLSLASPRTVDASSRIHLSKPSGVFRPIFTSMSFKSGTDSQALPSSIVQKQKNSSGQRLAYVLCVSWKMLPVTLRESLPPGLYGILCDSGWVRLHQSRKTIWQHHHNTAWLSQQHDSYRNLNFKCINIRCQTEEARIIVKKIESGF